MNDATIWFSGEESLTKIEVARTPRGLQKEFAIKMLLSKDVEFDTYAEQVAFLKGLKYESVENIEALAFSFHDSPDFTTNGKHVVSICFQTVNP